MGRGTGKTKAMVEGLTPGSIVVVHTGPMRGYVERMLRDLRGDEVAASVRVVTINARGDEAKLFGVRRPVVLDHAFEEQVPFDLVEPVRRLAHVANLVASCNPIRNPYTPNRYRPAQWPAVDGAAARPGAGRGGAIPGSAEGG